MNATPASRKPSQQSEVLRRGLRASVIEGVLATPVVTMTLPVNIFMTALVAKGLPLSKPAIGNISSMPFACNFLQVFITPLVTRWLPTKPTAIIAAALHTLSWAWLGLMLPSLVLREPAAIARFMLWWVFVASLFAAVLSVVWNGWMHQLVPPRLRGRYFSQRNRVLQGATLVFVLGVGCLLSWGGYSAHAFAAIIWFGCACRFASLFYFWRMPDRRPANPETPVKLPLPAQFAVVRRSHSLLLFIAFGAVWSFALNCIGPFYHVFLFQQLNSPACRSASSPRWWRWAAWSRCPCGAG